MSRPLSPEERLLWRRVTADVRPASAPASTEKVGPPLPIGKPAPVRTAVPVRSTPVLAARPRVAPAKPTGAATLDASWDRRLRNGQVEPDRVVDLHGLTLDAAHRRAIEAVKNAVRDGDRIVVLITGRAPAAGTSRIDMPLRGIIRASIGDWLAASPVAGRIAAVRAAHPRHGGAGAIYIVLRRLRPADA